MHIGICDDNEKDRSRVYNWLEVNYPRFHKKKVHTFVSGFELLQFLKSNDLDILFMDCHLGSMNGIDTSLKIREYNKKMNIIGISSIKDFAIFGYDADFSAFILKESFEKDIVPAFKRALQNYEVSNENFFSIKTETGLAKLSVDNTVYISSEKRKRVVYCSDGQVYNTYSTIKELLELLSGHDFISPHRSYILNLHHIKSIEKYDIITSLGTRLYIPRPRQKEVKREIIDFYFKG